MSVPFHYVEFRSFCYATEDEDRVEAALRTFLPEGTELDRNETEGHHGDPIVVLSTRLENADDIRHVLSRLGECEDLDRVVTELDERVDENCSFYVHLDKQAALDGRVELGEGISLRAKVEAYPAKKENAVTNAREILQSLSSQTD